MSAVKLLKYNTIPFNRILIQYIQSHLINHFNISRHISLICKHCSYCFFCAKKIALIISLICALHRICSDINRLIMSICRRNINSKNLLISNRNRVNMMIQQNIL